MTNLTVTPEQQPASADSRPNAQTRLAIERTLLAWIRTGLAMMGFGFVLDRFGFYLRELSRASHVGVRSIHMSFWFPVDRAGRGGEPQCRGPELSGPRPSPAG